LHWRSLRRRADASYGRLGIAECAATLKYPEISPCIFASERRPGILFWKKSVSLECFLYNSQRRQLFLAFCPAKKLKL
jgi:hypothetical protein